MWPQGRICPAAAASGPSRRPGGAGAEAERAPRRSGNLAHEICPHREVAKGRTKMTCAPSPVLDRSATVEQVRRLMLKQAAADQPIRSCRVALVGQRLNSVLFRAECDVPQRLFLIKVRAEFDTDPVTAAHEEYAALAAISNAMGENSRFTVPRPSPALLQNGCVVMNWVEGVSLLQQMTDWRTPPWRVLGSVRRVGEWLNRFHHARTFEIGHIDTARLSGMVDTAFIQARLPPAWLPIVECARRFLDQHAERVGRVPVQGGWRHGDFKPENVMLSGDRVFGIDIERIGQIECLRDVVNFLFHLDLQLLSPRSLHLLPFRRHIYRSFLKGYAGDKVELGPDNLAGRWLYLQRLLRFWADIEFTKKGTARLWHARYLLRHLIATNLLDSPPPG